MFTISRFIILVSILCFITSGKLIVFLGHKLSKRRDNVFLWRDKRDNVFLWERQFIFKNKPDFGLIGCSSVCHSYGVVFFF